MDITVILCTYNRSQMLEQALASVAKQELLEATSWEVLVVDNNSTDATRDVAEQFCRAYPGRFRYLFEPRPGKSHALNTGIREARGGILAFMDDDVTVSPAWLANLTCSLRDGTSAGAGGRILPGWSGPPPEWLSLADRLALGPLVAFDLGSESGALREPPSGTNMAFRKEMFVKHGGFRTDLGPRPGCEIRGEDTEFASRLLIAGETLRYEPSAVVYHPVPESRLRKKYFLDWWFDKGRTDIRAYGVFPESKWHIAGVPLDLFRRVAVWTTRWWFTLESSKRFSYKINAWLNVGRIVECYHQSPNGKRQFGSK
jgi:glycosyltransferase involved in cell wall biosynthesis